MKVNVVGAGHIAKQHLACLAQLPGVDVVGVCDRSPATAEATTERFGVPRAFADFERMLAETSPDVVHVTTPLNSHFPLALAALSAGAHVVVEKPIATDLGQVRALLARAAGTGRYVVEDHNYRFNANVRRLLERFDRGDIGRVVHVEVGVCLNLYGPGSRMTDADAPHPSLAAPGGAAMEFLTHMAYLVLAFAGPCGSVRTTWPPAPVAGGEFRALLQADGGATASLLFSGSAQPDNAWLRVHGTRLRAEAGLFEPRLSVQRLRGGPRPLMPVANGLSEAAAVVRGASAGLWRKLAGGPGGYDGLWELLARTYAALRDGRPPPVSHEQIEATARLVAALVERGPA